MSRNMKTNEMKKIMRTTKIVVMKGRRQEFVQEQM